MLTLPKLRRPSPRRPRVAREQEPEGRSIEIGIVCTIAFHIFLFWLAPRFPVEEFYGGSIRMLPTHSGGANLNIELAPGDLPAPPPAQREPFRFVETNPNAPENIPDKTENFGAQNQQAAQPEPDKGSKSRMPRTEGRDDFKNDTQILSGDLAEPQLGEAVAAPFANPADAAAQQEQARAAAVPLPGFDKKEGEDKEGVGTNISEAKAPTTNAAQLVEGSREAKDATGAIVSSSQATGRPQPRPRPRLSQAPPAILENRIIGAPDAGPIALDARWSEYGQYLAEFVETVRGQWYKILENQKTSPPTHSFCVIRFTLNSDGETHIVEVPEENCGRQGVWAAQGAIQDPQPYRRWTQDMVAVLGNETEITFRFYYYW
ncbi:MAG: hypothetical protein PHQ04_08940 [Opitutaceae bacterium]|nr:hypothetical protein [Opitutaceae bacterium]